MNNHVRALLLFVNLLAFWLLLSGPDHFNWLMIGLGVISSGLVTWLSVRMGIVDEEGYPIHLVFRLLRYLPWLFWQIVLSNLDVARRVWDPRLPISPRLISVPYQTKTSVGTLVYANSITLTPGTVTIQVREGSLLVHALTEEAAQALLSGAMHEQVKKLEGTVE